MPGSDAYAIAHAGETDTCAAAAFAAARDPMLVLDDDRGCVDLNRAACDLLGVGRAGLVGRRTDTFVPTEWRERIATGWSAFLREGSDAGEFETDARDGSRALFEFTAQARVAGGHHLWVMRDVTASRAAEAARRNLSAMLERSDHAVCVCSHDGVLLSWNSGAERLYGYTAGEAVGQPFAMLLPPDERAIRQQRWQRVWDGDPVDPFEAMRITKDGRSIVVAVTLTAIIDEFGIATGIGEISRDVTEQKYEQAALPSAQSKAVEAAELQAEFMASMNHELRVPLSGVVGITRLLEDTALDPQQREYIQGLRVASEGLTSAIETILDFAKLDAGTLELSDEPYDLRALVEEVCSVVGLGAASAELDILSYVEPAAPAVLHGDEQRVRQVLTTLLANAVKLTPAGEVSIHASIAATNVTPCVRVEIAARGAGIDPATQDSVFGSFAEASSLTPRRPNAAGFGFTIARRLVSLMGGDIGVESVAGEGSTFSLTLPLRGDPADPALPPQTELEEVRVLVVRANAGARRNTVQQLEGWNARVATATDCDEALVALRAAAHENAPFAAAVIDHGNPRTSRLDATALVRAIRAEQALAPTRVLLLVAPRDVSASAAIQADVVIPTPVGQTRLYSELTRVLAATPTDRGAGATEPEPSTAESSGRVLVAEDNPVNQLVAVRLLEQRGFIVDVANDGREAIVMHAHSVYDAIFMDCQMPEISGYEATREIRRREGTKRHTPIIAMTASTLPSDRERCIAAGMDYHTGKPIRPAGLDHILARALPVQTTHPHA